MGGNSSKETNTDVKWRNMKTDDISSTIPHLKSLSKDAKKLIASLNIPTTTDVQSSEVNVNELVSRINNGLSDGDKQVFHKIMTEMSSEDLSATSPFISSEMYNNLVNSKTSSEEPKTQLGGSRKIRRNLKGGMDDSSTSSTDSDLDDLLDSSDTPSSSDSSSDNNRSKSKNQQKKPAQKQSEQSSELSGGSDLSYLSSSADDSDRKSITDDKGVSSVSVNTSDINMVSDY